MHSDGYARSQRNREGASILSFKRFLARVIEEPDSHLARVGIVGGLLVALLSALNYGSLVLIGLGIAAVCLVYLKLRNRPVSVREEMISPTASRIIFLLFFVVLTMTVILTRFFKPYELGLSFYVMVAILCGLVAVEILSIRLSRRICLLVLFQIVLLSLFFRLAVFEQYPSILGVDPWEYQSMIQITLVQGQLPTGFMYTEYPVFPLLCAEMMLTAGGSFKDSLFLSGGLVELLSVILVFIIIRKMVDEKSALLSALVFAFYGPFLGYGTYSIIAMSVGITLFFVFFLLLRMNGERNDWRLKALIFLLFFAIVLTHVIATTVAIIAVLCFLIGDSITLKTARTGLRYRSASLSLFLLFAVIAIGYWMWVSGFMGYIVESIRFVFQMARGEYGPPSVNLSRVNLAEEIIGQIEFTLMVLLSVAAALVWLGRRKAVQKAIPLIVFGLLGAAIANSSMLTGFDAILGYRWLPFTFGAIAVILLFPLVMMSKKSGLGKAVTSLVVIVLVFTMLVSVSANVAAPLYDSSTRQGLEESEMQAGGYLRQAIDVKTTTDFNEALYFKYGLQSDSFLINKSYFDGREFSPVSPMVIRDYCLNTFFTVLPEKTNKLVGNSGAYLIEGSRFTKYIMYSGNAIYISNSVMVIYPDGALAQ